ncbi:hypothetical protein NLI96_g4256 [Meripilus lineatus]|uniref:Noc2-domain-containing protein n=1 Tax=Meripilus lineatus TaxID=2056292 RepID=A0AAD5V7G3_9APHY|nr:hypothetical protein NLI96_g4256 [Physisporinus lineatus]
MGKKAAKSTRKYAASGQLQKAIQARRKHQDVRRKAGKRRGAKARGAVDTVGERENDKEVEENGEVDNEPKGMTVDDFLGGNFMDDSDEDLESSGIDEGSDEERDDDDDISDDGSFASVDALEDDGHTHLLELSKLAEKDPEFYKYLQENDRELLEFGLEDDSEEMSDVQEDGDEEDDERPPILTLQDLRNWSKALLKHRSLRALRKLLVAFRSAVHMHDDGQTLAWTIDSPSVYSKLITTALKFSPVVLEYHCPFKTSADGKFKAPTQTQKFKALQKLIFSFFHNIIHLLSQLTDAETQKLALEESAKLLPYITSNRKSVKLYIKGLWSSADDSVRISAFLSIRKMASSSDESILNMVLKSTYLTLVRACRSTSAHTLPSINLMKNCASEIYVLDHAMAYQHAFGYIRQLAVLLRNSMKAKTKESYKQVYNWQFVHCVDFWSITLARACDTTSQQAEGSTETELNALIYPLVQVALGAIKLISNSRSYPFHFHIIRSLLHLTRHTHTYVPLAPHLLPALVSTLSSTSKPKASTLRPLDLETTIRAPQQYLKTRVLNETSVEEAAFLLAEYLNSIPVLGSVAFPEIVVPIVLTLRKAAKGGKAQPWKSKEVGTVKSLVERLEETAKWVQFKRKGLSFSPKRLDEVEEWERDIRELVERNETPLGKYVKVQRKAREKRRMLIEKAREGEDEILEE